MAEKTFTPENFDSLKSTCQKIISLCDENVDGSLMWSQKIALGDRLTDFVKNPIVKNSGVLEL